MSFAESYAWYIGSGAWKAKREEFYASLKDDSCYCCGTKRTPGFHVHHRTYERFMDERMSDLVSVCEPCHDLIHKLHRQDEKWKRRSLWAVTDEVRRVRHPGRKARGKPKGARRRKTAPRLPRQKCVGCERRLELQFFLPSSDKCITCRRSPALAGGNSHARYQGRA